MKGKLVRVVAMMLLLAVSVGGVVYAQGVGSACNDAGNFGVDHDTCVTCLNSGNTFPVCICKILDDNGLLDLLGFKNFGQCVKAVR